MVPATSWRVTQMSPDPSMKLLPSRPVKVRASMTRPAEPIVKVPAWSASKATAEGPSADVTVPLRVTVVLLCVRRRPSSS